MIEYLYINEGKAKCWFSRTINWSLIFFNDAELCRATMLEF